MEIQIFKQDIPNNLQTATEIDRWHNNLSQRLITIELRPLELQNLLQEIEDVLMTATEGEDWYFGVSTKMHLYELYKGLGGTKFK